MGEKKAVVWFAGGGLACIGLKRAGYRSVWAVEYDPKIAAVWVENFGPGTANDGVMSVCAVEDVTPEQMAAYIGVDLFQFSTPCKNASIANSNGGETEGDLSMARAVCLGIETMKPGRVLLENVERYAAFESFRLIVACLSRNGYALNWHVCNSADYGVPQTRKRLILVAVRRDLCPSAYYMPPLPTPTHCEGGREAGGLFDDFGHVKPWIGWYAALTEPEFGENLLPILPETQFAEWQLNRLPQNFGTCMVSSTEQRNFRPYAPNEPKWSVTASEGTKGASKALLVDGDGNRSREPTIRTDAEPAITIQAWHGRRPVCTPRALLVDGKPKNYGGGLQTVESDRRAVTLTASQDKHPFRAWTEAGRVVKMIGRALGRFQDIRDSDEYRFPANEKLCCCVVGNGVPPRVIQAHVEVLP